MSAKLNKTPLSAESIRKKNRGCFGLDSGAVIKAFFGGNALVAIIVLALITFFLFREGAEFFPQYRRNMQLYRSSGQEFVGLIKQEVDSFNVVQRKLNDVQVKLLTDLYDQGLEWEEVNELMAPFQTFVDQSRETIEPLDDVLDEAVDLTITAKEKVVVNETRREIVGIDFSELMTPEEEEALLTATREELMQLRPRILAANQEFKQSLSQRLQEVPEVELPAAREALALYIQEAEDLLVEIDKFDKKLRTYDPEKPYTILQTLRGFLFGTQWVTNSSWQDFYGMLPLLTGSLFVTGIALFYAVPLGVFSAIYVNQVARTGEQHFIKPYIEFISAIPSVVIGFFGIAVYGTFIRWLTEQDWLAWISFFPISERLNAFTAGGLLALMAVPTIFTLAEDALNNVPKAFTEASEAMGATRWQTIWRIQIPTSLSGIISAVLLGFGRVIGETMVVLLCAGNRISIPNLSGGAGTIFEPVHTMTGIIAQEMGEVVPGSIHYRALFCVGIVLFFLSLLINYVAQVMVRRYKISAG